MSLHDCRRGFCGVLACLIAAAFSGSAVADPLGDHLLRQLSCIDPPTPLAGLIALENQGRFDASQGERRDSATCWRLKPVLELGDIDFDHICAATEDPLLIAQFPAFFWRGRGTSPGETLVLTTKEPVARMKEWAAAHLSNDGTTVSIGVDAWVDGETEVECRKTLAWP